MVFLKDLSVFLPARGPEEQRDSLRQEGMKRQISHVSVTRAAFVPKDMT